MTAQIFPIPLEGAGTAEVESFASYVHRCAYNHGIYVGEFLRYLCKRPRSKERALNTQPLKIVYRAPHELVRPNGLTLKLVRLLEEASYQELGTSVLWFLNAPLGRSSEEVVKGFRWCPECIGEMQRLDQEPHFKLLWHMAALSACPSHGGSFESTCSACGSAQDTYRKNFDLGRCQQCGKSLADRDSSAEAPVFTPSWEQSGADITQLFSDLAYQGVGFLPEDGVRASLQRIFDHYWHADREAELYSLIPRDQLLAALHGDHPVSLKVTRRFAYRLGVSLYVMMSGHAHLSSGVLDARWTCELHPDFMHVRRRHSRDHNQVFDDIQRYLEGTVSPPTLLGVAQAVGVSVGYLSYRHSGLVKAISRQRRDHERQQKVQKLARAQKAALEYFFEEKYGDMPKSRKRAYSELRSQTGLPKWILKEAIGRAYGAVYGISD